MPLHPIAILLLFLWAFYIILLPGLAILVVLYQDLKSRFTLIEILILSTGIGISSSIILTLILDNLLLITFGTVTLSFLFFPALVILLRHKTLYNLLERIEVITNKKYWLRSLDFFKLRAKRAIIRFNASYLILILVLSFIMYIELSDLLNNIVLPARDPWFWLIESKKIALTGHFSSDNRYFESHPQGAAYFLGLIFLPDLTNPYYIVLFIGPFLSLLQSLGVYSLSKRVLNADKMAIYSVLVFGTSRLIIWRGKFFTPESIGLFLITILILFLFEKNLKAYIPGLLVLIGLALTSLGSLGVIIVPVLLYVILFKSHKIPAMIIAGIIGAFILLSSLASRILGLASRVPFNVNVWPLDIYFYNFAQWTFGYGLVFSFIGVIYYLLNRSTDRLFYVICFFELFVLISFYPLRYPVRNYPFFSIFASTLAAQGLIATIEFLKRVLPAFSKKRWNIKAYLPHLVVTLCIIYQVFFGMVRGYHAIAPRRHQYEDVAAALWLYDNSPENAVTLALTNNRVPYSYILYPRRVITNQNIYNFNSISDLVIFCFENDINYIIMEIDPFSQEIKANETFKEIYRNSLMVIFELIPMS